MLTKNIKHNGSTLFILVLWLTFSHAYVFAQQDIWHKMRTEFQLQIPASLKKETQRQITWHQKNPNSINHMTENAQYYLAFILAETSKRQLPSELALIPFVESNYDPFANSSKGASGLWQIMPEMASARNLAIHDHVDERRHVIKSTEAALNHLEYLYHRLDKRWDYAIAAYNAGEGRVRQAIRQAHQCQHQQPWTSFLPDETRKYLPKIFALSSIIKNPSLHPNALPKLSHHSYFSRTPLKTATTFHQVAQSCQIDNDLLHKLNPEWKGHLIHQNNEMHILLPKNQAFSCQKKLKKTALFNQHWSVHNVKKYDSLKSLAKYYQTSTDSIMQYNDLTSPILKPGTKLLIKPKHKHVHKLSENPGIARAIRGAQQQGPTQITHQVSSGETIESISKKHHVKTAHIAYWNNLKYPYTLHAGSTLIIWKHDHTKTLVTRHVVQPGDSLWRIAKKHNTSVEKLQQANGLTDVNRLKLKQVIKIKR